MNRIVISGASAQIGQLIVEELARHVPLDTITLVTRNPESWPIGLPRAPR